MTGTLFVVATPIGNLDDVTARALRVLQDVALIAAEDTRRTANLLARYAITTPSTSFHAHNELRKTPGLIARLHAGESIALVSDAGTPGVSDPGERLIRAAIDEGIRVEAIPGASAALAALVVSGLPSGTFTFMGFPPTKSKDRGRWMDELASANRTVVFFEAPHRIKRTLAELQARLGDRPVSVGRELTKIHEELVRGPISVVLTRLSEPRGEFTVVMDLGQTKETAESEPPSKELLVAEVGRLTADRAMKPRRAAVSVAKKYGLSANNVYSMVQQASKLVK